MSAIEHVDKWLREKMKGEEVRGLRYEALLDCLQQVEFRAEEEQAHKPTAPASLLKELEDIDRITCQAMKEWDGIDIIKVPKVYHGYRSILGKIEALKYRYTAQEEKPVTPYTGALPKGRTCRSCLHTPKCKELGSYNMDSFLCSWDPCRYAEYHGDMTPEPMFMREVCEALGWQGGTVHEAIKEIKRLKESEALK